MYKSMPQIKDDLVWYEIFLKLDSGINSLYLLNNTF